MPVRRLALDVDKVPDQPDMVSLALAIERCRGVTGVNVTVNEIDLETVGTIVTVEGDDIDTDEVFAAIGAAGAVLHSIDEVVAGDHTVEPVPRTR